MATKKNTMAGGKVGSLGTKQAGQKGADGGPSQFTDETGLVKHIVNFKFIVEVCYLNEISDVSIVFEWTQEGNKQAIDFGAVENYEKAEELASSQRSIGEKITAMSEIPLDNQRVDEKWVKSLCDNNCKLYIVNTEDKTLYDCVIIDLSSIILHDVEGDGKICFQQNMDRFRVQCPLLSLSFRIEVDHNLLSTVFKHELNPIVIEVDKIENLFLNHECLSKYEQLYVKYWFMKKEYSVSTQKIDHSRNSTFKHKHVFLLGLEDQQKVKEYLTRENLYFEIHDKDEIINDVIIDEKGYIVLEDKEEQLEEVEDPKKRGGKSPRKEEVKTKEAKKNDPKGKNVKGQPSKASAAINLDEIQKFDEKPIKSDEMGYAQVPLKGLLNPYNLKFDQTAAVYAVKVFQNDERGNLDLNSTARKKALELVPTPLYLDQATSIKVKFEIAFPVGGKVEKVFDNQAIKDTTLDKSKGPSAITKQTDKKVAINTDIPEKQLLTEQQTLRMSQKLATIPKKLAFERAIFVFSYKNIEFMKTLEKAIKEINYDILFDGEANDRLLRTKVQTEGEKTDKSFDFIGGIEIIDRHYRLYILEGVSGGSMQELAKRLPKKNDNTPSFKMMRNEKTTFNDRMFLDYNCDIKRIKLLRTIKTLVEKPDIYLRERVPLEIYNTVNKIKKMREKDYLDEIEKHNLWLTSFEQNTFERSYGDSVNEYDLNGTEQRRINKSKRNRGKSNKSRSAISETQDCSKSVATHATDNANLQDANNQNMNAIRENISMERSSVCSDDSLMKIDQRSQRMNSSRIDEEDVQILENQELKITLNPTAANKKGGKGILKNKTSIIRDPQIAESPMIRNKKMDSKQVTHQILSTNRSNKIPQITRSLSNNIIFTQETDSKFKASNKRPLDRYSQHQRKVQNVSDKKMYDLIANDIQPGENFYSAQIRRMRELARHDKDNFYTWSDTYLGASVDPYTKKEADNIYDQINLSKYIAPEGIVTIFKNENPQRHRLALHPANIKDLNGEPYHILKKNAKANLKFKEDLPIGKPNFKNFLPPLKTIDARLDDEDLTQLEKIELEKQKKNKDAEDFKKKLVVDSPNFYVKNPTGNYNLDKYKGMLHDPNNVKKKGLLLPNRILKRTDISMDKSLKPFPVSYNENEDKPTGYRVHPFPEKKFDLRNCVSTKDFNSFVDPPTKRQFVNKIMKKDIFVSQD